MSTLLDAQALYDDFRFENSLPIPDVIDTSKRKHITLQVQQVEQFLGLYDDDGNSLLTTVWAYGTGQNASYPGPTILAYQGQTVSVNWQNKLPVDGHLLPVDTSLHIAEPLRRTLEEGFTPIVTHLHGGHNDSADDGLPEQWFTQSKGGPGTNGPREVGRQFVTSVMTYENDQYAATLWYHDHTLGMTRLNVYAGLAGFYVLQDQHRLDLVQQGVLPDSSYDIGMAIQDRAFTSDGQLYYPAYKSDPLPGTAETVGDVVPQAFYDAKGEDAPSAVPEFFGDVLLVNGMAWPKLDVAAGDYTFRLLNGSDSRFYVLKLDNPYVGVTLVGTDGGLLPEARTIIDNDGIQESNEFIVLAPGDRLELVFDFSKLSDSQKVTLQNVGPAFEPFKGIDNDGQLLGDDPTTPEDETPVAAGPDDPVGNVMQFVVGSDLKAFDASVGDGTILVNDFRNLARDDNEDGIADVAGNNIRKVGLFEGADLYGRVTPMLGTAEAGEVHSNTETPDGAFGPLSYDAPITEKPVLGTTENWLMFNFTADTHPIHLHLTQFQVVEKRQIGFLDEDEDGVPDDVNHDGLITYGTYGGGPFELDADASDDIWIGDQISLRPEELGWQDTAHVDPSTMISVVAEFDKPGDYVWHCHILSHEDNEMMRPYTVVEDLV
jgi:spore coat protein A